LPAVTAALAPAPVFEALFHKYRADLQAGAAVAAVKLHSGLGKGLQLGNCAAEGIVPLPVVQGGIVAAFLAAGNNHRAPLCSVTLKVAWATREKQGY